MAEHYTDEDVEAVAAALCGGVPGEWGYIQENYPKTTANQLRVARAVLDAVAPAIAARALREAAADARRAFLSGKTLGMPSDVWLEERADEIEGR